MPLPPPADRVMALVLSDGEAAARCAEEDLARAEAAGDADAFVWALLMSALVGLREAEVAPALARLEQAEARMAAAAPPRSARMARHLRAQWHRREGRLQQALELLQALHAEADLRPPIDAFFTAMSLGTV